MSISHLVYVSCDVCGDPSQAVVGEAKDARAYACLYAGYRRIDGHDLCGRHWTGSPPRLVEVVASAQATERTPDDE